MCPWLGQYCIHKIMCDSRNASFQKSYTRVILSQVWWKCGWFNSPWVVCLLFCRCFISAKLFVIQISMSLSIYLGTNNTQISECRGHKWYIGILLYMILLFYLLGSTLGPIFLGAILDSSCDVWQETCGMRGSCWIYRKWDLGIRVILWWMGTKCVGVVLLLLAAFLYKPPIDDDSKITEEIGDKTKQNGGPTANYGEFLYQTKAEFSTKL